MNEWMDKWHESGKADEVSTGFKQTGIRKATSYFAQLLAQQRCCLFAMSIVFSSSQVGALIPSLKGRAALS